MVASVGRWLCLNCAEHLDEYVETMVGKRIGIVGGRSASVAFVRRRKENDPARKRERTMLGLGNFCRPFQTAYNHP